MKQPPFYSSKRWLAQAREDLTDFEAGQKTILSNGQGYTVFEGLERKPGFKVIGFRVHEPPPTLTTKAANIVNAFRSALDQAT